MVLLITGMIGVLTGKLAVPRLGATAGTPSAAVHEQVISPVWARRWRRVSVVFLLLVVVLAVFFWPVWTAQTIPYEHWRWRMWFTSWI